MLSINSIDLFSRMSSIALDKREFRSIVVGLRNLNSSWSASQTATFLQQSEHLPSLKRCQLVTKVGRTLTRNIISDKKKKKDQDVQSQYQHQSFSNK